MNISRKIVFELARRALWARRELRKFDALHRDTNGRPITRVLLYGQFNEAQSCYRTAKTVLDEVETEC